MFLFAIRLYRSQYRVQKKDYTYVHSEHKQSLLNLTIGVKSMKNRMTQENSTPIIRGKGITFASMKLNSVWSIPSVSTDFIVKLIS